MTAEQIEAIYEALALGIDRAGAGQSELFLARVALLLARETGDADRALALIGEAGN